VVSRATSGHPGRPGGGGLCGLRRARTEVVFEHRLATVERCDEIGSREDGRVVEHGSRLALAADPGSRFAELLRTGLEPVLAS